MKIYGWYKTSRRICKNMSGNMGKKKTNEELKKYTKEKVKRILKEDKVISILGLLDNDKLIGFISLFKYDGLEMKNLTPWYATIRI